MRAAATDISTSATARWESARGSARTYSRWDKAKQSDRWTSGPTENPLLNTVFYAPAVVNAPGNIASDIRVARETLKDFARRPLRLEKEQTLPSIRQLNCGLAALMIQQALANTPVN